MLKECPVCQITWEGEEVPDGLERHNSELYDTREKAEQAATAYGWTVENRFKFSANVIGVEYGYTHPEHYDGVSEWQCKCGARVGRFSGAVLKDNEAEGRNGIVAETV